MATLEKTKPAMGDMSFFEDWFENRHQAVKDWKARTGKKVIGYFCILVPEEIIDAAGALPVRLTGTFGEFEKAEACVGSLVCPFSRSLLHQAMSGVYDYLDGIVVPHSCDMIPAMYDFWRYHFKTPYLQFINFPHKISETCESFLADELNSFKSTLESFTKTKISDANLRKSIIKCNENRALLKQAYELRKTSPPGLSGAQALSLVLSSQTMPKDLHNDGLKAFLAGHKNTGIKGQDKVRLLLSGSEFEDLDLMTIIENAGAYVVADDLCTGSRYFWNQVELEPDLIRALAKRYLGKTWCPCLHNPKARIEHVLNMAKEYQAQGVIFCVNQFCECHEFDYVNISTALKKAGLPTLLLEPDYSRVARMQLQNRVAGFIEMLSA